MGIRHVHAGVALGMKLVGLHDLSEPAASRALDELHLLPNLNFGSLRELLESARPDALVVSSTANGHAEACEIGIEFGVSTILCEKPFVDSVATADRLCTIAEEANVRLAVNHQVRSTARFEFLRAIVTDESYGGLVSLTASTGNIGLAMGASHYVELFRLLSGNAITGVRFFPDPEIDPNPRGRHFLDPAGRLILEAEGGSRMFLDFGSAAGHGMTSVVATPFGRVVLDDVSGRAFTDSRTAQDRVLPRTRYSLPGSRGEVLIPIEDAATSTQRVWQEIWKEGDYCTARQGAEIVRVLAAAEFSGSRGGDLVEPSEVAAYDLSFNWA